MKEEPSQTIMSWQDPRMHSDCSSTEAPRTPQIMPSMGLPPTLFQLVKSIDCSTEAGLTHARKQLKILRSRVYNSRLFAHEREVIEAINSEIIPWLCATIKGAATKGAQKKLGKLDTTFQNQEKAISQIKKHLTSLEDYTKKGKRLKTEAADLLTAAESANDGDHSVGKPPNIEELLAPGADASRSAVQVTSSQEDEMPLVPQPESEPVDNQVVQLPTVAVSSDIVKQLRSGSKYFYRTWAKQVQTTIEQKRKKSKFRFATARGAQAHWDGWIIACAQVKRAEVDAERESLPSGKCELLMRISVHDTQAE